MIVQSPPKTGGTAAAAHRTAVQAWRPCPLWEPCPIVLL